MKECINALGQMNAPVYFDMGLLTKALEITLAKLVDMQGIMPCEGGIHLLMAVFAGIGHLYDDAGLRELLFESDVFSVGSAQQILSGKDSDKALWVLKLADEALSIRFLIQFKMMVRARTTRAVPWQCTSPFARVLRQAYLTGNQTEKQSVRLVSARLWAVVKNDLLELCYQSSEKKESSFLQHFDFVMTFSSGLCFRLNCSSFPWGMELWDVD